MLENGSKTSQVFKGGIAMLAQYAIVPSLVQPEQAKQSKLVAEWKAQAPIMSGMFGEDLLEFLAPLVERLHEVNKVDYNGPMILDREIR
jgi:hypothetical protein